MRIVLGSIGAALVCLGLAGCDFPQKGAPDVAVENPFLCEQSPPLTSDALERASPLEQQRLRLDHCLDIKSRMFSSARDAADIVARAVAVECGAFARGETLLFYKGLGEEAPASALEKAERETEANALAEVIRVRAGNCR